MSTGRGTLAVLAVLGLALAGCSGGGEGRLSKSEYEEKVRSEYAEVQEVFRKTNVPSLDQLAERVEDAQDQLRDAADELEGVEPPQEVAADNRQVVQGLRAYARDLDRLREAAERGDQGTVDDFNTRLARSRSTEQIAEAAERMRFKGYDLGPIAEE